MKIYKVGGAIRDRLLGLAVTETDWVVVGATPEQLKALDYRQVGKDFPVFLHPITHDEYALARTERKTGDGHTGFAVDCNQNVTLEEDLKRRDLTINAIAEDESGKLIDPYDGQKDIQQRILRHVSEAFREDPLRVFRVARFAARFHHLNFSIAPTTRALINQMAQQEDFKRLPGERIWRELEKTLHHQDAQRFLAVLHENQALEPWFKEFTALNNIHWTELAQACRHISAESNNLSVRFSVLMYLITANQLTQLCQRLRVPKHVATLAQLVNVHHAKVLSSEQPNADRLISLFEALDGFRRPVRLQRFFIATKAIALAKNIDPTPLERYEIWFQVAQQTQPNLHEAKGREVGVRLRQARVAAIEALLDT